MVFCQFSKDVLNEMPTFQAEQVSRNNVQAKDVPLQTPCRRNEIFLLSSVAAPVRFHIQPLKHFVQSPYKGSADWREPLEY